jgi:Xaa-Pro dipeptidase
MPVHFSAEEMEGRRHKAIAALQASGLDGLLMFRQESMYWLTGYDTFGFALFQCLYLGADGDIALLTRTPDFRQARFTSDIEDIRIWPDREGEDPAIHLRDLLEAKRARGKKLGIEFASYGLTAANWRRVEAALDGFCILADASDLIATQRVVKSAAELEYIRKAAALADDALDAATRLAKPGAYEGDILAAMQGAVFSGGGDYAGNEFIIGSGQGALMCRYHSGRRHLDGIDQLTLEWAGAFRRYHAAMMRTLIIGAAEPGHIEMHKAARDALEACMAATKPGRPMGDVYDAHARVFDAAGLSHARLLACGYGMGAVYSPLWVDPPMFCEGNRTVMQENSVNFLHMILFDDARGLAMSLGQSMLVTASGCENLSRSPLDLIVNP